MSPDHSHLQKPGGGPSLRLLALLFVIALIPRVWFLLEAKELPLFDQFYLDTQSYDRWAGEIAAGKLLGERAFHMAPVYPYFLGGLYAMTGRDLVIVRVVQHGLGAISAVLVFLIAHRLLGRRVAWIAFVLGLGYAPFLYFEGQLLASFLGIFLGLMGLYAFIAAIQRGGSGLWIAGLLLGFASVARPNLLFFLPFAALWLLFAERAGVRKLAIFCIAAAIGLSPAAIYNKVVADDWVLISTHGGISFYLGNNDFTQGTYVPPPEIGGNPEAIDIYDSRRVAERELGRTGLKASEISKYWFGKSVEYMKADPVGYARLTLRKIALYFNAYEIPLDVNYEADRELYRSLRVLPFGLAWLFPLAAIGAFLVARRGTPAGPDGTPASEPNRAWLLVFFVLANAISVVAFFITARYRQTGVPALAILGAVPVSLAWDCFRAKRWGRGAMLAGAFAMLFALFQWPLYPGKETSLARAYGIAGKAFARAGDFERADELYRKALAVVPEHLDTHMNRGLLFFEAGRYDDAELSFGRVTQIQPGYYGAWHNLGNVMMSAGYPGRALVAFEQARRIDPAYAGSHDNVGRALLRQGRFAEAEASFDEALRRDPAFLNAWSNKADVHVARGDFEGARAVLAAGAARNGNNEALALRRRALVEGEREYERLRQKYEGRLLEATRAEGESLVYLCGNAVLVLMRNEDRASGGRDEPGGAIYDLYRERWPISSERTGGETQ
ncbi:MAG: tetratricopeptide repeat protein [Gemmatimonadetes bacterium]|nr:tetratricopeptide repeat protein [Gemmatimonadota bacterium]